MNNENMKTNEEIISLALTKNLKVHLVLKDKSWRNGFVKEISADFFIFEDLINGREPIFFLELIKVEPYMEGGE